MATQTSSYARPSSAIMNQRILVVITVVTLVAAGAIFLWAECVPRTNSLTEGIDWERWKDDYCELIPLGVHFPKKLALAFVGTASLLVAAVGAYRTRRCVNALWPVGIGALLSIAVLLGC